MHDPIAAPEPVAIGSRTGPPPRPSTPDPTARGVGAASRPRPRDAQVTFGLEDLFFSRTDRKGVITSGNDVFMRVSGYGRSQMVGRAHNMVRHPDMPRAVFRVLWERLAAGDPVAAYVQNLSADGSYYWVMAAVVPVPGGYLSIRLKPTSALFDVVRGLYRQVVDHERAVEAGEARNRKQAVAAGVERLTELLAEHGFSTYEQFMARALPEEVDARAAALAGRPRPARSPAGELGAVLDACARTDELLDGVVEQLAEFVALGRRLADRSGDLAEEVRLGSLNASIATSRVTENAAALSMVASLMRARAEHTNPVIARLSAGIERTVRVLDTLRLDIALARLQNDMTAVFTRDLAGRGGRGGADMRDDLAALTAAVSGGVERLLPALDELPAAAASVAAERRALESELKVLAALTVTATVESARAPNAGQVHALFAGIAERVHAAQAELGQATGLAERVAGPVAAMRAASEQVAHVAALVDAHNRDA